MSIRRADGFLTNQRALRGASAEYAPVVRALAAGADAASGIISEWPGYAATPLLPLRGAARELGVENILYKDEAKRFGLGSFKALGGAYAIYRVLLETIEKSGGVAELRPEALLGDRYAGIASGITVTSATAGNHGRSLAWGAKLFGCRAVIFVHAGVGSARVDAIARYGAEIRQVEGDYDHAVRVAAETAAARGWTLVSDTSCEGYTRIPRWVMQGYTLLFREVMDDLSPPEAPTHLFVQGGVGGLAAAGGAYLAVRCAARRPTMVVVEPSAADCLYQSALAGAPRKASGDLRTDLLGMACGEPSLIAWKVLHETADAFLTISDEAALAAMRELNSKAAAPRPIVAGECAGAGLAGLRRAMAEPALRAALDLDTSARVLLIGTEGATDTDAFERILSAAR